MHQISRCKLNAECLFNIYYSALDRIVNNDLYTSVSVQDRLKRGVWDAAIRLTFCSAIYCSDRSVRRILLYTHTEVTNCSDEALLLRTSHMLVFLIDLFSIKLYRPSRFQKVSVSSDAGGNRRKCIIICCKSSWMTIKHWCFIGSKMTEGSGNQKHFILWERFIACIKTLQNF